MYSLWGFALLEINSYLSKKKINDESSRFNPKFDIPEFEGRMHADDFLDWLNTVERVFEYYDPPERQKVKLVAIKMNKNASFWWEKFKEATSER